MVRWSGLGWAVLLMAGSLFAQQGAPPASPELQRRDEGVTTLRTAARLVLLDVVVTDGKGRPVKGLKASDFTLLEDGAPQVLSSFQEHEPMTAEEAGKVEAAAKLPPNHFTNYDPQLHENGAATVFLLDALDTPVQAQMYLREQMIAYMKTVPVGTRIAIFQLDTQMHMIQGFTSDPEVLQQVVSSKRNEPLNSPLLGGPGTPGYVRERMRQDYLTQGMQALARYLGPFPGRKNLIWFTGRVPVQVYGPGLGVPFPDVSSFIDDFSKTTDVLTLNRIAVYPVDSRGLQTEPGFSAANSRGGGGGGRFETRQFYQHGDLDDVAEATGGRAFYNTNGLKEAIAEVVDTGSNYYTLSYTPSNRVWDGGFRKLQVKVAGDAPAGVRLEYRRGYYARNNDAAESRHIAELESPRRLLPGQPVRNKPSPAMEAAMKMGAGPARDISFVVGVTPDAEVTKVKDGELPKDNYLDKRFRKDAFREYRIHYSVNPGPMRFMPDVDGNYHGSVEFVAVVYDDQGGVVNSKMTGAQIDVDQASYAEMMRGGMGSDQTIAIPAKGNFFLRVGVRDLSGGLVGSVEIPVDQIKLGVQ
jgi:VWFA-related protein